MVSGFVDTTKYCPGAGRYCLAARFPLPWPRAMPTCRSATYPPVTHFKARSA